MIKNSYEDLEFGWILNPEESLSLKNPVKRLNTRYTNSVSVSPIKKRAFTIIGYVLDPGFHSPYTYTCINMCN